MGRCIEDGEKEKWCLHEGKWQERGKKDVKAPALPSGSLRA